MKTKLTLLAILGLSARILAEALPPDAVVEGRSIGEWSAEWWKWVYSVPTNQNPMFDADGSLAGNGQPGGSVFFVANMVNPGAVTRTFAVAEGQYLLFPVRYVTLDNVDFPIPLTVEELRDTAAEVVGAMTNLHASVNGRPIDVTPHRVMSPVFSFNFESADNLSSFVSGHPVVGLIDPIVSDGYWLMLEPLPAGTHVIQFGGEIGPPFNSSKEITAIVTITPTRPGEGVEALLKMVRESGLAPNRQRPLLASLNAAKGSFQAGHFKGGIGQLRAFQNKVRAQLAGNDGVLAEQLLELAQQIVDKVDAE